MKGILQLWVVIVLSLLLGAVATSLVRAGEVFKADFEDGSLFGWKPSIYQGSVAINIVDEGAGDSKKCLEIKGTVLPADGDCAFGITTPSFAVSPGKTYTFTFDSKHNINLSKVSPYDKGTRIIWLDANEQEVGKTDITGFDAANEQWHKEKITNLTAPANAAKAQIGLSTDWPDFKPGIYWRIDNLSVSE